MFKKVTPNPTIQEMQYAGIKQALDNLKRIEDYSWNTVGPILYNLKSILKCYTCQPCKYLKKRIKQTIDAPSYNYLRDSVEILIAEIETFLKSHTETEVTITDVSTHKI